MLHVVDHHCQWAGSCNVNDVKGLVVQGWSDPGRGLVPRTASTSSEKIAQIVNIDIKDFLFCIFAVSKKLSFFLHSNDQSKYYCYRAQLGLPKI